MKAWKQALIVIALLSCLIAPVEAQQGVTRYVRYAHQGDVSYGILEGDTIRELQGDLFDSPRPTGETVKLSAVKLLAPIDPSKVSKVLGVAVNYNRPGAEPRTVPHPRWFAKLPSSINGPEGEVEIPPDTSNLNYEGELVFIIGKKGRHIPVQEAATYVFGVTVGNDFSENTWYGEQKGVEEPSRLLSKAVDTWACLGPAIVTGIDYSDLGIEVRMNGQVVARGRTRDMVNNVPALISYLSRYVTLMPGDVIYTGTVSPPSLPGTRRQMQPGDVIEVEIEKLGRLRNTIVAMKTPAEPRAQERYPKINVAVGYQLDPGWPQKPAEAVWAAMPGVAVDADGNIWTFNRGNIPIQVYTPEGKLVRMWGQGDFKNPHHIKIDRQGNIWVADTQLHTVRKFTPEGKLLLTLGTPGEAGADDKHLNQPTDMVVTRSGDIFVADGYGNNRIVHFDATGRFVKTWGKLGTGPGEFSLPHAIDVDSHGRLYVADRNNVRVQVFDQSGTFLAEWRNLITPWGIWITPKDEIYICGSSPMRWDETRGTFLGIPPKDQVVMKFDPDGRGRELWTFSKGEDGKERPGELNWVHAIAVDASGNLYLGDINGKRAQRFIRIEPPQPTP